MVKKAVQTVQGGHPVQKFKKVKHAMKRATATKVKRTLEGHQVYLRTQEAPFEAHKYRKKAPTPDALLLGRKAALNQVNQILAMSLSGPVAGKNRTSVPDLRAGLENLAKIGREQMSKEGGNFVLNLVHATKLHLGAVNTNKSFKPFMEVVKSELELAGYLQSRSS
eukprot:gnl/MRDRNA2_/MRDRNA2_71675_c0_seq1.p1 gnl/MRDRNA2_/MRDRNA2_71675_c0~~gnl/MRDRNA2_/MRDRNA2_71675_c0_seq1.p1  ORF type:complete len:166 (-),score=26.95 gnl/MRDRNA2_/MRDRNA2_71675_c0_seq1:266-763(-)